MSPERERRGWLLYDWFQRGVCAVATTGSAASGPGHEAHALEIRPQQTGRGNSARSLSHFDTGGPDLGQCAGGP
jgi:hypothetical protein